MTRVVTVLGGGAMGTACAFVLAQQPGRDVRLWVRNTDFADHISKTRENSRLLPGVTLPSQVLVSANSRQSLTDAEFVVVCIPTKGIRQAFHQLRHDVPATALVVSTVKGIENDTLLTPCGMLLEILGIRPIVALGGPCHAEEVARRLPASVVAACDEMECAKSVQSLFSTDFLRVYANSDRFGVELAAALKNVIAIAAGICDGLGYGDNARAALLTRGLAEMVRFGGALGAATETFYGLAGVGDLTVTCGSRHSRNRAVGEMLGRGMTLREVEASMHAVAEGVLSARSIVQLAAKIGIEMPIATEVCHVLFDGKHPAEATEQLMRRPLKTE